MWRLWFVALSLHAEAMAYSVSRREIGRLAALGFSTSLVSPSVASAAADNVDLVLLDKGLEELESLLSNWKERTTNCKYAEVNRELLVTSAKKELLEASTENALISKNSKAVKTLCKRDPQAVRLALGFDGKMNKKSAPPPVFAPGANREATKAAEDQNSPLAFADLMIRRQRKDFDGDFEAFVEAEEKWLRAMSGLEASTYASGVADFGATVSTGGSDTDSALLDSARLAAEDGRDALRVIVSLLQEQSR